ncbi:MAG: hypothetical protein HC827_00405 [Cyanobacteria bacterium RM1_2_2]|nr:hypothetical protein [Cyanobacteria bacterium RM1_2_2]
MQKSNRRKASRTRQFLSLLGAMGFICVSLNSMASLANAQSDPQPETQPVPEFVLPTPTKAPIYYPEPSATRTPTTQPATPTPTPAEETAEETAPTNRRGSGSGSPSKTRQP